MISALRLFEAFLGHLALVIVGFILMVVGLALGVTMVLLPIGLVVGIGGVLLFVTGLFGRYTNPNPR
jgi:hypothetical protein